MNKKIIFIGLTLFIALGLKLFLFKEPKSTIPSLEDAPIINVATITVQNAYAFATVPTSKTAAAFMVIKNNSANDDILTHVKSDISEHVEIHQNTIDPDDGMMMMRKIKGLDIPSKESVSLDPKGYHVMFLGLNKALKINETFPITLVFEKAGEQVVNVTIVPPGSSAPHNH